MGESVPQFFPHETAKNHKAYIDNLTVHSTDASIVVKKIDNQETNKNFLGQELIRYKISCNPTTIGNYYNLIEVTYHDSQLGKNEDKKLTIPVMGRVKPSIEAHPSFLSFNETEISKSYKKNLIIKSRKNEKFSINEITFSEDVYKVKIMYNEEGSIAFLTLVPHWTKVSSIPFRHEMKITTTSGDDLIIPIHGIIDGGRKN